MTTVIVKEDHLDENRRVSNTVMLTLNSNTDLYIGANLGVVVFPGDVSVNRMVARSNSGISVLGSLTSNKTVSAYKSIMIEGNCAVNQGDIKSQNGSIEVKGKLFASDIKCGHLIVSEFIDCINVRAYKFSCENLEKCTILGVSNIVVTGGKNRTLITDNPLISGDSITLTDEKDWTLFQQGLQDKHMRYATINLASGGNFNHFSAPHVDLIIYSPHEVSFNTLHCRNLKTAAPLFVTEWLTTARDIQAEALITVQGQISARKVNSTGPVNCYDIQVEKTVDTPLLRAYTSNIPQARTSGCVCGKCGKKVPVCKEKLL
jgi:hypothetical protein